MAEAPTPSPSPVGQGRGMEVLRPSLIEGAHAGAPLQVTARQVITDKTQGVLDGLSDVGRLAHLAYRKTEDDVGSLADELFARNKRTMEESLLNEMQRLGYSVTHVQISDPDVLRVIRDRADWAALKISQTYNYDLARAVGGIIRDVPTANRWVIAHRLGPWEAARNEWKESQIGVTEAFVARDYMVLEFYRLNNIEVLAYFGYSLICEVCQEIAAGNPHTLEYAEATGLPHPNCMDMWHYELPHPEDLPPLEDLWWAQ